MNIKYRYVISSAGTLAMTLSVCYGLSPLMPDCFGMYEEILLTCNCNIVSELLSVLATSVSSNTCLADNTPYACRKLLQYILSYSFLKK